MGLRSLQPRWFTIPPRDPGPPVEPPPVPAFVPSGRYHLMVEKFEERVSQFNNRYYHVRCAVILPEVHPDFRVHLILSLTPKAMWRLGEFVEATTGERPEGQFLFNPREYMGSTFYADLTVATYNQKQFNQVGNLYFWEHGRS